MDVMEAIRHRRSVRSYSSKAIPQDVLSSLCDAMRLAPSANNNQPWRFVLTTEPELKDELARAARNQSFIAEAPVIVAGVGFPEAASKRMGGYWNSVDVDVAIALDHLTLAAAAEGIGTCWIGAFEEAEVKKVLNVPAEAKVIALTPLGYPASPDLIHAVDEARRKPRREVIVSERFK